MSARPESRPGPGDAAAWRRKPVLRLLAVPVETVDRVYRLLEVRRVERRPRGWRSRVALLRVGLVGDGPAERPCLFGECTGGGEEFGEADDEPLA